MTLIDAKGLETKGLETKASADSRVADSRVADSRSADSRVEEVQKNASDFRLKNDDFLLKTCWFYNKNRCRRTPTGG